MIADTYKVNKMNKYKLKLLKRQFGKVEKHIAQDVYNDKWDETHVKVFLLVWQGCKADTSLQVYEDFKLI